MDPKSIFRIGTHRFLQTLEEALHEDGKCSRFLTAVLGWYRFASGSPVWSTAPLSSPFVRQDGSDPVANEI